MKTLKIPALLQTVSLAALGGLILTYGWQQKLTFFINQDYFWLCWVSGAALVGLALYRLWSLTRTKATYADPPVLWSALLILIPALLGWVLPPKVLSSQTALSRGTVTELASLQSGAPAVPQPFSFTGSPEKRSLLDWVRATSFNPEPDVYQGQPVKVKGFVYRPPDLPENYGMVGQFMVTCCAADARTVGFPIRHEPGAFDFANDQWVEVTGVMKAETVNGVRQPVIQLKKAKAIEVPKNPYIN
jgi:uncharacterized repeat protein (TIGR03943 family)